MVFVETKRGGWRVARNVLLHMSTLAADLAPVSAKNTSNLLAGGAGARALRRRHARLCGLQPRASVEAFLIAWPGQPAHVLARTPHRGERSTRRLATSKLHGGRLGVAGLTGPGPPRLHGHWRRAARGRETLLDDAFGRSDLGAGVLDVPLALQR